MFPQHLPDPTNPALLSLVLEHVRQMAQAWGDRIRFVMPGEGSVGRLPAALPGGCRVHDIRRPQLCTVCAPITHYAPRTVDGFFEWLPAQYGNDINRLNARWGSNFGSFTQLRAGVTPGSCRIPAAEEDYYRYLVFLWQEVSQAHYTAAKVQRPGGWYGVLAFGVPGIERSWLGSDAPVSGDWYGAMVDYRKADPLPGNGLRRVASAALLAGRPAVFAFTSPPHDALPRPFVNAGGELEFALRRQLSDQAIQLLFADVLTAGTVHIGYLRESTWGFADHAPTRARVEAGIRTLVQQLGDTHLRFMSGHARIHVGFEDFELLANPRNVGSTENFGRALLDGLRRQQWPHGLFTDPRVLVRHHALATLRRSVVVLPLREDLHFPPPSLPGAALLTSLAGLFGTFGQPSTGTVLVVARNSYFVRWLAALVPMGSPPRTRNGSYLHDVQRWRGSRLEILIFDDATFDPVRAAGEVVDYVRSTPSLRADPITPVTVTDVAAAMVEEPNSAQTSVVTDGVNAFVAVSNLRTQAATTVSLAVDADWQQRSGLGFTIEGQRQFVLQPGETRFVRMVVDPGSVDPADLLRLIGDLAGLLPPLARQNYAVAHGERAVAIARRLAMAGPAEAPRAVAAIAAICRLLFVKAIRDPMQQRLEVRAVKLWRGQRAVQTAVASGRVQVLAPVHGQLEIASATMTAGLAWVPYATRTLPQWDFGQGRFVTVTAAMARETLDVHVHEDGTDAHASLLVP